MKVVTQILLTFSFILALLLLSAGLVYINTNRIDARTSWIIHDSADLNQQASTLRSGLFQIQQTLLDFLRIRDPAAGEKWKAEEHQIFNQMQAILQQDTALSRFISAEDKKQVSAELVRLDSLAQALFSAHQLMLQQLQQAERHRQQVEDSLTVIRNTLDRVSTTLLASDPFLQKSASQYANSLQQLSILLSRAFFSAHSTDIIQIHNLVEHLAPDIQDGFSEILDSQPALKSETDLVQAHAQLVALFWPTASADHSRVLDELLQARLQDEKIVEQLAASQSLYQTMSQRLAQLSDAVYQRNLHSGTEIRDQLWQLKQGQVLALILAIVVICTAGYYLTRQIRTPLQYARRSMQKLADGDYSQVIRTQWSWEFAELMGQLNGFMHANRDLINRIKLQSSRLQQLSAQNQNLTGEVSSVSDEQFQSISRISSAVTELEQASSQVMDHSNDNASACQSLVGFAEQGIATVQDNLSANQRVDTQLRVTTEVINSLAAKSHAISHIVDVIENIANQTNLLALNAAIEAARAGEQGRGFAVVSDEVRELASRTKTSTGSIQQMITDLQSSVRAAVEQIDSMGDLIQENSRLLAQNGDLMTEINQQVQGLADNAAFISSATGEQYQACAEISHAIDLISVAFRDSGNKAGQVASNSHELTQMSEEQVRALSRFITEDGSVVA